MRLSARAALALLALLCVSGGERIGAAVVGVAGASPASPWTFLRTLQADLTARLAPAQVPAVAGARVVAAIDAAVAHLALPRDHTALDAAVVRAMAGDIDGALHDLRVVLERPEDPSVAARAQDACTALLWRAARCDEERACAEEPTALYWRADCALERGEHALAVELAEAARLALPNDVESHAARFVSVRGRLAVDPDARGAVADADTLLASFPEYPAPSLLALDVAAAQERAGRVLAAARRLHALEWERPWHPAATEARARLEALALAGVVLPERSADEWLDRATRLRRERQWTWADHALDEVFARIGDGGGTRHDRAHFERALNAYDSARFDESLAALDAIGASGAVSSRDIAKWRARALSSLGREDEAVAAYLAYFDRHGASDRARTMLEFTHDLGRWDEALRWRSEAGLLDDRSFDSGFARYLAGDLTRAAETLEAARRRATGTSAARTEYWLARTRARLGEADAARTLYGDIAATHGRTWYALQARNRLAELDGRPPRAGTMDFAALDQFVLSGRAGGFVEPPSPATIDPVALRAFAADWGSLFPRAVDAAALLDVGARTEAMRALRDVVVEFGFLDSAFAAGRRSTRARPISSSRVRWAHEIDNRARPAAWWGMASTRERFPVPSGRADLDALVARHEAIRAERDRIRPALDAAMIAVGDWHFVRRRTLQRGLDPQTDPADPRWRLAFPLAYAEDMSPHARALDVNPYLVWAIMIVESELNPDSVSSADAYGLLQVIPKTGQRIQLDVGDPEFGAHQLIEPQESLRYGTWYLAQLVHNFRGQELLAAIAYNAGPHQVARWLQWRGDGLDLDEFIETVPFDGARRYAHRVYQHMDTYARLWLGAEQLPLGNELDADPVGLIYY